MRRRATYQSIKGAGIDPEFLGHVTEGKDGRAVGSFTEWIQGTRAVESKDIDGCKKALSRLHELSIKHGDVNRLNFLVRNENEVVLIDFEMSIRSCPVARLHDEASSFQSSPEDSGFRCGVCPINERWLSIAECWLRVMRQLFAVLKTVSSVLYTML